MRDINAYGRKCLDMMEQVDIPVGQISFKPARKGTQSFWGKCCAKGNSRYEIRINQYLLDESVPEESLMDTILHELCHAYPGRMNHTGGWWSAVNKVNSVYGYNISEKATMESKNVSEDIMNRYKATTQRYGIQCQKCNMIHWSSRLSATIKNPNGYRCRCGGKLLRIK